MDCGARPAWVQRRPLVYHRGSESRRCGHHGLGTSQWICRFHPRSGFGTILALTHATGPSVLQVRGQDVLPEHMGRLVAAALAQHETALISGAIVVVEEKKSRVRVLPL
jgi:hypothetical protein